MSDDAELLRRFAESRCETSFSELVRRHLGLVYHTALRRVNGDAHRAEDIAQQVFLALAKAAPHLDPRVVLSGWLYVTTAHAAANIMRSEQRRKQREAEAHRTHTLSLPGDDPSWEQLRPELDTLMDELNESDRNAVLLRFLEDRSYAQVGAALQISADAARMRVDRALEKLRALLARRGIESTAAVLGTALGSQAAGAAPAGLAGTITTAALHELAAAGAGTVGAAPFWTFMTTSKTLAGVAGAAACMAIGAAIYEASGVSPAARELAALRENMRAPAPRADIGQREAEAVQRSPDASNPTTPEPRPGTALVTATRAQAVTPARSTQTGTPAGVHFDVMAANPEFQQISLRLYRSTLPLTYGPFYRRLGLSAEQINTLEDLMVEQYQISMDTMAAARAQGMSVTDAHLRQLTNEANRIVSDKMRSLLGAESYQQFLAYRQMTNARASVDTVAAGLYYTEAPLTLAQADRLVEIVDAQTEKRPPTGLVGSPGRTNWESVIAQSQDFLSDPQLAVLRALAEKSEAQQEYSDLASRLTAGALQESSASTASTPARKGGGE